MVYSELGYAMEYPKVLIKLVAFSVVEGKLKVLLPLNLLPHKRLSLSASLDQNAKNILSVLAVGRTSEFYLEQLYTFTQQSSHEKNIIVAYYMLLPYAALPAKTTIFFANVDHLRTKNNDSEIITYALQRLRWKLEYTNVVYSLLPKEFTLTELQNIYETILGKTLDKRNFRKKILSLKLVKKSGNVRKNLAARPALTYTFASHRPQIVKIFS